MPVGVAFNPWFGLPIIVAWVIGGRINRTLGVPFALLAFVAVVLLGVEFPTDWKTTLGNSLVPSLQWVTPAFSIEAMFSIALPLFIVTMASQNIPVNRRIESQ